MLTGVWGQRHRRQLKKHHRVRYYNLLTAGTLNSYLTEIELQAQALFNDIVMRLSEEEKINENLKATDPMEWVKRSNNIRNRADEIVNQELFFIKTYGLRENIRKPYFNMHMSFILQSSKLS